MSKFVLKLYVAGQSPRSRDAIAHLERLCAAELDDYELAVIDVLERPQLAEGARVLATPTLVKEQPLPARRVIGDLSDADRVLGGLDIRRPSAP